VSERIASRLPGTRHLEREVFEFERMLEGITMVLAPEKA